jgi:hypothetical protein
LRSYAVLVDGMQIGKIKNNAMIELPVNPGPHSLQLKISWCRSNAVPFSVGATETATFECGSVNAFLAIIYVIFSPWDYLWLRQVS